MVIFSGCTQYVEVPVTETVIETRIETVTETVVVEDTKRIEELEEELQQYRKLLLGLEELYKNVYYVHSEGGGTYVYGTGFSLEYKDKFYLITAGHIVDGEWGYHPNLGFKDYEGNWIYPKLIEYRVEPTVPDYAIFYSDKVDSGFNWDKLETIPSYRLGIDIPIQEDSSWGELGSCGSPIIDLDGEVIGLHVGYVSDIDDVLYRLDWTLSSVDSLINK